MVFDIAENAKRLATTGTPREGNPFATAMVVSISIFWASGFQLGQGGRATSFLVCCCKRTPQTLLGFGIFIIEFAERFQS